MNAPVLHQSVLHQSVLHHYARPASIDDALALQGRDPSAAPIAGGTDLLPLTRARLRQVSCVVDLGRLGLNQVRVEGDELVLGALVTMSQAASDPQVLALAPLLVRAVKAGASPQIRHRATLGGNLLQAPRCPWFRTGSPGCHRRTAGSGCDAVAAGSREGERWLAILGSTRECAAASTSDLAVALRALDARLDVLSLGGGFTWPLERLWTDAGASTLPSDALIQTIRIPLGGAADPALRSARAHNGFEKVRDRASFEFAVVSVAVDLTVIGDRIGRARVAAGGVAPVPWRLPQVEAMLVGQAAVARTFGLVSALAANGAQPFEGNAFKARLLPRLVARALESAMEST